MTTKAAGSNSKPRASNIQFKTCEQSMEAEYYYGMDVFKFIDPDPKVEPSMRARDLGKCLYKQAADGVEVFQTHIEYTTFETVEI